MRSEIRVASFMRSRRKQMNGLAREVKACCFQRCQLVTHHEGYKLGPSSFLLLQQAKRDAISRRVSDPKNNESHYNVSDNNANLARVNDVNIPGVKFFSTTVSSFSFSGNDAMRKRHRNEHKNASSSLHSHFD